MPPPVSLPSALPGEDDDDDVPPPPATVAQQHALASGDSGVQTGWKQNTAAPPPHEAPKVVCVAFYNLTIQYQSLQTAPTGVTRPELRPKWAQGGTPVISTRNEQRDFPSLSAAAHASNGDRSAYRTQSEAVI